MPQHKSAEKRVVTNERNRLRNVAVRSRLRSSITEQREISGAAEAKKVLPATVSEIDRAKKRGIIPARRADRLKSRLARRANKLAAQGT
jgi:small subunit ribosomal protein S20